MGQKCDIQERIVSLLSHRREGLTLLDIAGALGIHRHTVRKYVNILTNEGAMVQRGVGQAKLCYLSESFKTVDREAYGGLKVREIRKKVGEGARTTASFVLNLIAGLPRFELPKHAAKLGLIVAFLVFISSYLWFQTTAYRQRIQVTSRVREDMLGNDLIIECDPGAEPRIEGLSSDRYKIGDRIVIYDYNNEDFRLVFGKAPDVYEFGNPNDVKQSLGVKLW